jgi:hypothetical protein
MRLRIGYHDGCDAGYADAGSPFYESRNATEPARNTADRYAFGWYAGYQTCIGNYQRIQRGINALFAPP